ncbi:unnamed protein product [Ectocarpus sp. 6 AP-2014]
MIRLRYDAMKCCGSLLVLLALLQSVASFAPTPVRTSSRSSRHGCPTWQRGSCSVDSSTRRYRQQQTLHATSSNNWFAQFWPNREDKTGETLEAAKNKLKQRLLDTVRDTKRGISTSEEQRKDIDELIAAIEPFNPNAKSVTSESLSARWILEWTTEREIIFLMERGLPGKPSGPVEQDIDVDARTLSNRMIFGDDSLFEVASSIDPEDSGPRVNFEFEACKLKYGGFTIPLPPVGKGWFESVYLDQDLRVTRDVRGDVTVLVKGQKE